MGFCYPGRGKSGDLAPRKECAPLWHQSLLSNMNEVKLVILVGQYAQSYYLGSLKKKTLTERVQSFNDYLPHYFVLPHPSPRNNIWLAKNTWFLKSVVPKLQDLVSQILKVNYDKWKR
jgi:uracil-DNA glycosylase